MGLRMGEQGRFDMYLRYVNIFNDMGKDWEAIVNLRDTRREARFVEGVMAKKGVLLDLCCGTGRHAIVLRKRGWKVIGIDLSKRLLAIAKQRMKKAGVKLPLIRADMRCFPIRNRVFIGVMNMFTSFGYPPSEEEDLKCLSEIRRTLRKKGRFLLDLANRDHIMRNFRERDWAEFEPYYLLERRSLDFNNSKLVSLWTLVAKDHRRTKFITHEVRLYTLNRIGQLCKEAGLSIKEVYGGYEKQEFSLDTSRMIIVAQKS
jgi:SAM-dependent methyltransferase